MVNFAGQILPNDAEMVTVLTAVAGGTKSTKMGAAMNVGLGIENTPGVTAAALVENIPAPRRAYVFRSLNWLLKLGILKVARKLQE